MSQFKQSSLSPPALFATLLIYLFLSEKTLEIYHANYGEPLLRCEEDYLLEFLLISSIANSEHLNIASHRTQHTKIDFDKKWKHVCLKRAPKMYFGDWCFMAYLYLQKICKGWLMFCFDVSPWDVSLPCSKLCITSSHGNFKNMQKTSKRAAFYCSV